MISKDTLEKEIWKDVVGCGGYYQVSSIGRVRSLDRKISYIKNNKKTVMFKKGKILALSTDKDGYKKILLVVNSQRKMMRVNRLVGITFLNNFENLPVVHHLNAIRDDDRVENLQWVSHSTNAKEAFKIGSRNQKGTLNNAARLNPEKVKMIKELWAHNVKIKKERNFPPFPRSWIAKAFKVSQSCIANVIYSGYWQ
jgi:hypothetical protein|tara:strand:- start:1218 stop:1808 length:591 start_codon:yes stop_codon:yes gene_type:complete